MFAHVDIKIMQLCSLRALYSLGNTMVGHGQEGFIEGSTVDMESHPTPSMNSWFMQCLGVDNRESTHAYYIPLLLVFRVVF
jgi:hypothetical protein